tara:strand:- start:1107 stop:1643 length:537 start_codon:yes stop_codon:yes gene_type:complete
MSLKLIKLRWRLFYWTLIGRIKKLHIPFNTERDFNNKKKVLIFFPMNKSAFKLSQYTFRKLGQKKANDYIFVTKEEYRQKFQINVGKVLLINHSKSENMLSDEKLILNKLKNIEYDTIIDLNEEFHLGIARLISQLSAKLKVGFAHKYSDRFYNMQLDISKSDVLEKGFKQVDALLIS